MTTFRIALGMARQEALRATREGRWFDAIWWTSRALEYADFDDFGVRLARHGEHIEQAHQQLVGDPP